MIVRTKYSLGDSVVGIYQNTELVQRPCERCGGKGELELKEGGSLPCPKRYAGRDSCDGGKVTLGVVQPWSVQRDSAGLIGQVRLHRTASMYCSDYTLDRNEYMVSSTGVGSGRIWYEDLLYPTVEEAQAECDRRNANPQLQEGRENLLDGFNRQRVESTMEERIEAQRLEIESGAVTSLETSEL